MNKVRRKEIASAIALMEKTKDLVFDAKDIIESAKDEEEEYVENMPENLCGSVRCEMAESAVEFLDNCLDTLEEIYGQFDDAIDSAEEAKEQ